MRTGELFPTIKEPNKRDEIWENILQIAYLILSNNGLAKDLKVLEPVMRALGTLVPSAEFPKDEQMTI